MLAALGLNPAVYLTADPALELALNAAIDKALEMQGEWRQDLAVRIINQLGARFKMK